VLDILQKEKVKRDKELAARYKTILDFKRANPVMSLEDERGNIMIQSVARLSDALTEARIGAINAKASYEAAKLMLNDPDKLKQLVETQLSRGVYISFGQEKTQLRTEISQLGLELSDLRQKVKAKHPAVKALNVKIAQLKSQLDERENKIAQAYLEVIHQQWLAAKQREVELESAFEEQRNKAQELNAAAAQYAMLQSELRRTENLCDILDNRIKELNVTEDVGALNINILEVARAEEKPTKPKKARIMAMALVLGLMLGVGLALLLDWMDQRLRSAEEISSILGVPVLGVVPSMPSKETVVARGQKVHLEPTSTIAEAYRTIRTAVYFGVPDGQAKTLLVTSPTPRDGKTTLVSNLAIAMAQSGQRTLVLDADFRIPMQHEVLQSSDKQGLSTVLTGQAPLDKVIQRTGVDGLDILPCGPIPPNPSEMLNSDAFTDVLKKLSERYDRIMVDSPPVMPVADARILSAMCDVTLVVLRAEKSTRKASEQARDGLLSVGAHILGAVVNDVPHGRDRYGYYSGYGYYGYRYDHYGRGTHGRKGEGRPTEVEEKTV